MIALDHVTVAFGNRVILDDLSQVFDDGVAYVLRAPSGAGKTTLLNVLAGYLQPDSGTVVGASALGYLIQEELLFTELTVAENLAARASVTGRGDWSLGGHETEEVLERVDLPGVADVKVARLSGGERRRVEIAGMLLADPPVLLLDEPAANLDPETARTVYETLWRIQGERTVVVATHEPEVHGAPRVRRDLHLAAGRIHVN